MRKYRRYTDHPQTTLGFDNERAEEERCKNDKEVSGHVTRKMPEGPEVRKYADALSAILTGRTIHSLTARTKEARKWLAENGALLAGRRMKSVRSHVGVRCLVSSFPVPSGAKSPHFKILLQLSQIKLLHKVSATPARFGLI